MIEELLKADKKKESIVHTSAVGRQVLHIAIEQKVRKEVIELLLKADAERNEHFNDIADEIRSIQTKFKGMVGLYRHSN